MIGNGQGFIRSYLDLQNLHILLNFAKILKDLWDFSKSSEFWDMHIIMTPFWYLPIRDETIRSSHDTIRYDTGSL